MLNKQETLEKMETLNTEAPGVWNEVEISRALEAINGSEKKDGYKFVAAAKELASQIYWVHDDEPNYDLSRVDLLLDWATNPKIG